MKHWTTHPARVKRYALALGDVVVIVLAFALAFVLRAAIGSTPLSVVVSRVGLWGPFFMLLLYLLLFYLFNLYETKNDFDRVSCLLNIFLAVGATLIVTSFFAFFLGLQIRGGIRIATFAFSRLVLAMHLPLVIVGLFAWRNVFFKYVLPPRRKRRVVLLGFDETTAQMLDDLERHHLSHHEFVARLGPEIDDVLPTLPPNLETLTCLVERERIDTLVYAVTAGLPREIHSAIIDFKYRDGMQVWDFPTFYSSMTGKIPMYQVGSEWLLFSEHTKMLRAPFRHMKRLVDVAIALPSLIVLSPLLLLIAAVVKLDSRGPVLFRQPRIGYGREVFTVLKFRTMVEHAEKATGPVWAVRNDPRTTRIGSFLRRTGLDELPQLINILRGEMSFVGFRPIRDVFEKETAEKMPFYSLRYSIKPGVTGWAQVMCQNPRDPDGPLERFQYDMFYIQNASFFLDLIIVFKTLQKVLARAV